MAINKVKYGDTTLIDLSTDTVASSDDIVSGKIGHLRDGSIVTGTGSGGVESVTQDEYGYVVLDDESGTLIVVDPLSVTDNGTYTAPTGHSYSPVTVNVSGGGGGGSDAVVKGILDKSISSLTVPDGTTTIGEYALYQCRSLSRVTLPNSITTIGIHAFNGCTNLATCNTPSSLVSIGTSAFINCTKITHAIISDITTTIGTSAFNNCTQITGELQLPNTLTTINNLAFLGCYGITKVSCNGHITTLGASAFAGNSTYNYMQLTEAHFPNLEIASLGIVFGTTGSYYACRNMVVCDIGKVSRILANAFNSCYKLQTLILRKTDGICALNNVSAFLNTPMRGRDSLTGTVYVPSSLISTYQGATNWSTIYNEGYMTFAPIEGSPYEL